MCPRSDEPSGADVDGRVPGRALHAGRDQRGGAPGVHQQARPARLPRQLRRLLLHPQRGGQAGPARVLRAGTTALFEGWCAIGYFHIRQIQY